jgi:hypothetical protein
MLARRGSPFLLRMSALLVLLPAIRHADAAPGGVPLVPRLPGTSRTATFGKPLFFSPGHSRSALGVVPFLGDYDYAPTTLYAKNERDLAHVAALIREGWTVDQETLQAMLNERLVESAMRQHFENARLDSSPEVVSRLLAEKLGIRNETAPAESPSYAECSATLVRSMMDAIQATRWAQNAAASTVEQAGIALATEGGELITGDVIHHATGLETMVLMTPVDTANHLRDLHRIHPDAVYAFLIHNHPNQALYPSVGDFLFAICLESHMPNGLGLYVRMVVITKEGMVRMSLRDAHRTALPV